MAARDCEPELFLPHRQYWIAGPTYDLGEKEFRVVWMDLIVGQKLGLDKRIRKSYSKRTGEMSIQFPWHTRIEVRSGERPESLVGEGLHGVIIAEAAKHKPETFERFIRPALADYHGWATFTTTPEGQNWLYEIWQLGRSPSFREEYESWRFPSWLNNFVYPGGEHDPEIELLRRTMPDDVFLQEIAADFTAFAGKIYTEFDEITHAKRVEFNPAWPNYIFWDWGYVNPLAAIEVQITPRDEVRIWREHYRSYMTLDEHFSVMRDRPQPDGYRIDGSFGDAADPEAVAQVNQKFCPCIALPEAKENWRDGIDLVRTFLKMRDDGREIDEFGTPSEGVPGLVVDLSCVNTIKEFNTYKGKKPTQFADPVKESAQRKDDHAMDAIRYGLMHIFRLGATTHLSDVYAATPVVYVPPSDNRVIRTAEPETVIAGASSSDIEGHFFFRDVQF
jgi:hypothetical protein